MANTALTVLGMWILHIPGIGLLGLFVFICSFIPIAGVFISTAPIAFVALTEYGFLKVGCAVLCCAVLCCAVLCCAVLCCAVRLLCLMLLLCCIAAVLHCFCVALLLCSPDRRSAKLGLVAKVRCCIFAGPEPMCSALHDYADTLRKLSLHAKSLVLANHVQACWSPTK